MQKFLSDNMSEYYCISILCAVHAAGAAGMCRSRYMHKAEVHGAAMHNE